MLVKGVEFRSRGKAGRQKSDPNKDSHARVFLGKRTTGKRKLVSSIRHNIRNFQGDIEYLRSIHSKVCYFL